MHTSDTIQWRDQPLSHLMRLSWPIVVSMLSYSVMTLVDTLFVGRLGPEALAGVGLGGTTYFVMLCFPMGTLYAVKIMVSQAVGAGRNDRIPAILGAGIWTALAMGFAMMLVALGVSQVLPSIMSTPESAAAASEYLGLRSIALSVVLVRVAIEQARMGMDDSKSPMRVAILTNVTNIGLDYLLIVVLNQGVAGAAIATVAAQVMGTLTMVWIQHGRGFGLRLARLSDVRAGLKLGLPSGAQFMLEVGSFAVMVALLARISDLDAAANQIGIQVLHFGFLPCMALGEGASIMAGQAIGAGRRDLVDRVARVALLPALGYGAFCSCTLLIGGDAMARGFTEDPELVALTIALLRIGAIVQIADGANIVARSILRGVGDVQVTAWLSIGLTWATLPTLTWALGMELGLGAVGGWYALVVEMFLGATIFWVRLCSPRWHAAADRSLAAVG